MTVRTALLRRTGTLPDGRATLLRPTRSADAGALVALRDAIAAEREFIPTVPGDRSVVEEELVLVGLLSQGGLSIVVEVEGEVMAHLLVQRRQDPAASHMGDVAIIVSKSFRRLGLGRMMLLTACDWGRAVGLRKLCLDVFASNAGAIALYHAVGFVQEGNRTHVARLTGAKRDVLMMGLQL